MDSEGGGGQQAASVLLSGQASAAAAQLKVSAVTAQLWRQFQGDILERVTVLEKAAESLLKRELYRDGRRQAEREAHKLAGSLGMLGYPLATEWAREIKHLLQGDNALQPAQALRVTELVVILRQHLGRPPVESPSPTVVPASIQSPRRMLIISEDTDLAERVGRDVAAKGLEIQRTTISRIGTNLGVRPVIILLDVPASNDPTDALASIAAQWPEVPVVVLAAPNSAAAQIERARGNGQAYIHKLAVPSNILEVVEKVMQTVTAERPKILAVDDDPLILAALQTLLSSYEFTLVTHADPLTLLEALEKTTPDLLILDIDMQDLNGIELCRMVRNDPRWCTLPVLFLTAQTDPQTAHKVFAVRADDYVLKPFVEAELLARIRVRLERASTLNQMTDDLHRITISRDDLVAEVKLRKECEEELQRSNDGIRILNRELQNNNAKLREFDQRKDEFVNNVSHEIRTPLTIIRESISQVADGLFGEVPATQRQYLNKSLLSVDRLVNIINDLLAVAKIENLKLQVLKTKVRMSSLVEDVMSNYEDKAQAKGLGLRCELPLIDLHASIDQEKVLQVFGNLISNAIKFTEKGHITISIAEKEEFIECKISDTGKGMAQEDIPKLFNKFEQIGRHQSDGKGTGLGLTISKGIVELHGGNIYVISEEHKGSTFTFTLPKYSLNESLIKSSKQLLVSAIEKFHQFTIVKLIIDTPDHQLVANSAVVNHLIRACLYRRVDEVVQEGRTVYIVLPDTKKADGHVVIERIRKELKHHNTQVYLGVQMLSYPDDGRTEDELTVKFEGEKEGA
jgi:signal transduction histidine kinase/HPt (histidine-containing phosphotransfer) domain-containing protein